MALYEVRLPQLGVNEDTATIYISAHQEIYVNEGVDIATIETSKASTELYADRSGFIKWLVLDMSEVRVSQIIAIIATTEKELEEYDVDLEQEPEMVITNPAWELIDELGLDIEIFDGETRTITKAVVQEYYEKTRPVETVLPGKIDMVIYGAGRAGEEILHYPTQRTQKIVFVDDYKAGEMFGSYSIMDRYWLLDLPRPQPPVFVAIAEGKTRLEITQVLLDRDFSIVSIQSPNVFFSGKYGLGAGVHLKSGVVIGNNVQILHSCIIDNNVTIAHDCIIKDGAHLAPGCSLGSAVTIGELTIVGIGASIASGITIGSNCIITPGSSVIMDIPDNSIVGGVPGKTIGNHK